MEVIYLACQLSWQSTAPVSQRSWVQIPYRPEFFSGLLFRTFSGLLFWSFSKSRNLNSDLYSRKSTGSNEKDFRAYLKPNFSNTLYEHSEQHNFTSFISPLFVVFFLLLFCFVLFFFIWLDKLNWEGVLMILKIIVYTKPKKMQQIGKLKQFSIHLKC